MSKRRRYRNRGRRKAMRAKQTAWSAKTLALLRWSQMAVEVHFWSRLLRGAP